MAKSSDCICIKQSKGFDLNKIYKCVGKSGKYVEVVDSFGDRQIMLDIYFKDVEKKTK